MNCSLWNMLHCYMKENLTSKQVPSRGHQLFCLWIAHCSGRSPVLCEGRTASRACFMNLEIPNHIKLCSYSSHVLPFPNFWKPLLCRKVLTGRSRPHRHDGSDHKLVRKRSQRSAKYRLVLFGQCARAGVRTLRISKIQNQIVNVVG